LRIQLELLHFWDGEALSRRKNQQIETKQHSTDDVSQQNSIPHDNSRISEESTILAAESEEEKELLNIEVSKEHLKSKRKELLDDLWWLQHSIISRRKNLCKREESE